jgi:hypothetical protein
VCSPKNENIHEEFAYNPESSSKSLLGCVVAFYGRKVNGSGSDGSLMVWFIVRAYFSIEACTHRTGQSRGNFQAKLMMIMNLANAKG